MKDPRNFLNPFHQIKSYHFLILGGSINISYYCTNFSVLTSSVYPVIASYKAFEAYSRLANKYASSNFKVAGISVPLNFLYREGGSDQLDEELQVLMISIQKWFIYWIVFASVQLVETVLFLRHIIPLYSTFKLGFVGWLIFPMIISEGGKKIGGGSSGDPVAGEQNANSLLSFDHTKDWISFTNNGAGLVYFQFIRPWIEGHFDSFNPSRLIGEVSGLVSNLGLSANTESAATPSTLDSSFIMVKNFTSKLGYGGDGKQDTEEYDLVENVGETKATGVETKATKNVKGWLW